MEELRREGHTVRMAFVVVLAMSLVLVPFLYHLVPFLLLPILIPLLFIFAFVIFTGFTDFYQKRMIILNIVFAVVVIALYEVYVLRSLQESTHIDLHLNVTIWLIQILVFNLLFIIYRSVKAYRKIKELKRQEE